MTTHAVRRHHSTGNQAGLTMLELIVAGIVAAIVGLAVMSLYISSLDAWDTAGSRLTLQRGADIAVERIVADVRRGSHVDIGSGGTAMTIYRTTAYGDSAIVSYQLVGDQVTNSFGTVLVDKATALSFASPNGVKVSVSLDLLDDRGTSGTTADDTSIHVASTGVCRNRFVF